jgi:hypothetical protein
LNKLGKDKLILTVAVQFGRHLNCKDPDRRQC